jgi:hypothetical protein
VEHIVAKMLDHTIPSVTLDHTVGTLALDTAVAFDTTVAFAILMVALLMSSCVMWCKEHL